MKKFLILLAILLAGVPAAVSAANTGWQSSVGNLGGYLSGTNLESNLSSPLASIIQMALVLLGMIFLTLTVYAGFIWLTAAGNEEKVTKAQGILRAAVIGMVIVTAAYTITYFITKSLGGTEGSGARDNGRDAVCQEQGGSCIGKDDTCPGGRIIEGFTSCRCCIL